MSKMWPDFAKKPTIENQYILVENTISTFISNFTMIPNSQLIFLPLRGKKRVEKKFACGGQYLFKKFRLWRAKIESIKLVNFSPAAGNTFSKFSPAAVYD